jgi:integrase
VRPPKVDTLPEEVINQIVKLPAKLHKQRKDFMYRDTLLILVGTLMGLRIHEAISLTYDDLLSPSGYVNII